MTTSNYRAGAATSVTDELAFRQKLFFFFFTATNLLQKRVLPGFELTEDDWREATSLLGGTRPATAEEAWNALIADLRARVECLLQEWPRQALARQHEVHEHFDNGFA